MLQVTVYSFLEQSSSQPTDTGLGTKSPYMDLLSKLSIPQRQEMMWNLSPMFSVGCLCTFFYDMHGIEPRITRFYEIVWKLAALCEDCLLATCVLNMLLGDTFAWALYGVRFCLLGVPFILKSSLALKKLNHECPNRVISPDATEVVGWPEWSHIQPLFAVLPRMLRIRDLGTTVKLALLSMVAVLVLPLVNPLLFQEALGAAAADTGTSPPLFLFPPNLLFLLNVECKLIILTKASPIGYIIISCIFCGLEILTYQVLLGTKCRIANSVLSNMTNVLFSHSMALSKDYHDSHHISEIKSTIDKAASLKTLPETLSELAKDVLRLIITVAYLSYSVDIRLAYLAITMALAYTQTDRVGKNICHHLNEKRDSAMLGVSRKVTNGLNNRALAANHRNTRLEATQVGEAATHHSSSEIKYLDTYYGFEILLNHIMNLAEHLCYVIMLVRYAEGSWSYFRLISARDHWHSMKLSLCNLSVRAAELDSLTIDAKRVEEFLDTKPSVSDGKDCVDLQYQERPVSLANVSFSYREGEPVLKNVTFDAENRKITALVGASGSGKSTILNLVARELTFDGVISIGGQNVENVTIDSVKSILGFLGQHPLYMEDLDIRKNVKYGRSSATDTEVVSACKAAMIHDTIESLRDGYSTVLTSAGLSGGQLQRLALARELLRSPKILLLDEPTSALDIETEAAVFDNILSLRASSTIIFTTHKLRIAKKADRIIVLQEGKVVEQGTHDELLQIEDGKYLCMWNLENGTEATAWSYDFGAWIAGGWFQVARMLRV